MSDGEHKESSTVEEKYLEQKVSERMERISSELAHDLRSPLQTIQNAIYLLERKPDNKQLYLIVRQSLTQATEILDNFREFYKAHIIQRFEVDPVKVLDLAFSDLEIPEKINLIRETGTVEPFDVDPTKIAMAIRKLLENAIDAMPNGGELRVKIMDEQGSVKIIISDTGVGISPEIAEILFTPFLSGQKNGRGLGIPTAKRIIESHGGEISYKSEASSGTVFNISLPRSAVNL